MGLSADVVLALDAGSIIDSLRDEASSLFWTLTWVFLALTSGFTFWFTLYFSGILISELKSGFLRGFDRGISGCYFWGVTKFA
ncbi:hypothetical protein E2542_SST10591 [Spatholobus suberectus]|nr:hypothetical protein E2542_SST10591 [Spatholobus suberectus]